MPQQESRCHHSYVSSWVRQQHGERVAAAIALKPQHLKGSNVRLAKVLPLAASPFAMA